MACNCKKLPTIAEQAENALRSGSKVVGAALTGEQIYVSEQVFSDRMSVCLLCEHMLEVKNFHRCAVCGCWLDGKYLHKAKLATEICPKMKW